MTSVAILPSTTFGSLAAVKPATSMQVRSRFFYSLGIESKPLDDNSYILMGDGGSHPVNKVDLNWVHPRSQRVACFQEPLKYNRRAEKYFSGKRRQNHSKNDKSKKQLRFNESVNVIPIPMRTEYSNRVRARLWTNPIEMTENAARNTVEFAAEGWDWRSVTEDERMYRCVATGELIHPCHYEPDFQPDA